MMMSDVFHAIFAIWVFIGGLGIILLGLFWLANKVIGP